MMREVNKNIFRQLKNVQLNANYMLHHYTCTFYRMNWNVKFLAQDAGSRADPKEAV